MLPRFFAPDLDPASSELTLSGEEAHHLHRVLRLRVDDEIVVFDGRGHDITARVAAIGRDAVRVRLVEPLPPSAEPAVRLTLVQGVLKGDAMDGVIRDCTMVGVETIQPVLTERTTVKASMMARAGGRWHRIALAAAKQSGRSYLPTIEPVAPFEDWLARGRREHAFVLLEPAAAVPGTVGIRQLALETAPARASVLVGPEGGWTAAERDSALRAGCTPVSLGRLTFRADAVPLAATAALLAIWDR